MSLNYQLTNIRDWQELTGDEGVKPVTQALIFATMAVGMGQITEANAHKFAVRLEVVQRVDGPYMVRDGKPSPLTVADVQRHIGLGTNASTLTDAQFRKNLFDGMLRDAERAVGRDEDALTQTAK